MRQRRFALALLACAILVSASGGIAHAGAVTVTGGWIRALPGNAPAGGYFTLTNDSGHRIVLTGAESPVCGMLMLHKTETESGMASMSGVTSIPIAVGGHVTFAPGGYHLMCMNPTAAVEPGNKVPVTLIFEDGTKVTSEFAVRGATGR